MMVLWLVVFLFGEASNPGPMTNFDNPDAEWETLCEEEHEVHLVGCNGGDEEFYMDEHVDDGQDVSGSNVSLDLLLESRKPGIWRGSSFYARKNFEGQWAGYVFKLSSNGQGYYWDETNQGDLYGAHEERQADASSNLEDSDQALGNITGSGNGFSDGQISEWPDYIKNHDVALDLSMRDVRKHKWVLPLEDLLFGEIDTSIGQKRKPRLFTRRRAKKRCSRQGVVDKTPDFVGKTDKFHLDNGLWAIDSVNPNGLTGLIGYLSNSSAHIVLGQESKVVDTGDKIAKAQLQAKKKGWNMALAPALETEAGGVSAGVAIAVNKCIGMTSNDISMVPDQFSTRIVCTHVSVICKGGVHFISIYCWCI